MFSPLVAGVVWYDGAPMGWHSRGRAPTAPSPCTMSGDELRGGYFTSTRISPVRANPRGFSSLLAAAWGLTG